MSDTEHATDSRTVRKTLLDAVRKRGSPDRSTVVTVTAIVADVPQSRVVDTLDELERQGEVYLVGDDNPEVKLP